MKILIIFLLTFLTFSCSISFLWFSSNTETKNKHSNSEKIVKKDNKKEKVSTGELSNSDKKVLEEFDKELNNLFNDLDNE